MRVLSCLVFIVALNTALLAPAAAVLPDEVLQNQRLEMRARAISSQLRCLVCPNETIDDSNAGLARDLRILVRERLLAGDSDKQVVDFVVARYGEYVLLQPRFGGLNLVLWLFPAAVLTGAALYLILAARAKRRAPAPLTPEEEEQMKRMLHQENSQ